MTSSGHAPDHVTHSQAYYFIEFFSLDLPNVLYYGFVSFLEGHILREFQSIEKFVISWQRMILQKRA